MGNTDAMVPSTSTHTPWLLVAATLAISCDSHRVRAPEPTKPLSVRAVDAASASDSPIAVQEGGCTIAPAVSTAKRLDGAYVELADGTYVRLELDAKRKWTITKIQAWTGIEQLSTGGYAWSPTCGIKGKRAHCWSLYNSNASSLGRDPKLTAPPGVPTPVAGEIQAVAA